MSAHELVTVAHGTRNAAGNDVSRVLAERAGVALGLPATAAYVELAEPLFADVVAAARRPVLAVPLLLSTGFHITVDLPEAVQAAEVPVAMGPQLGPHPLLATAQVARLVEAGAQPGQRVVLVAAGSSRSDATDDQLGAVAALSAAWGAPVVLATLSGLGQRPADVIRADDAVSPYLLSPGYFHDRIRDQAPPGAIVAEVIGPDERVVELIVERARTLLAD